MFLFLIKIKIKNNLQANFYFIKLKKINFDIWPYLARSQTIFCLLFKISSSRTIFEINVGTVGMIFLFSFFFNFCFHWERKKIVISFFEKIMKVFPFYFVKLLNNMSHKKSHQKYFLVHIDNEIIGFDSVTKTITIVEK